MEEKLPSREVVQAVARMQQYMLEHIRELITQNSLPAQLSIPRVTVQSCS